MVVQVHLADETERVLRGIAVHEGQTPEAYLEGLAEREAGLHAAARTEMSADEFERGLDSLSGGLDALPSLPADFGRADVYGEHA